MEEVLSKCQHVEQGLIEQNKLSQHSSERCAWSQAQRAIQEFWGIVE